ncbi:MAG: hypothetical protein V3T39_08695, partial [Gammaproteobacteria bacterium]
RNLETVYEYRHRKYLICLFNNPDAVFPDKQPGTWVLILHSHAFIKCIPHCHKHLGHAAALS